MGEVKKVINKHCVIQSSEIFQHIWDLRPSRSHFKISIMVLWIVTSHSFVGGFPRFWVTERLQLQGWVMINSEVQFMYSSSLSVGLCREQACAALPFGIQFLSRCATSALEVFHHMVGGYWTRRHDLIPPWMWREINKFVDNRIIPPTHSM
jgi:hypothetical protein